MRFGNKQIVKIYKGVKEITSTYLSNALLSLANTVISTTLIQVTGTLQTDGDESLVVVGGGTYTSTIFDIEGGSTWAATLGEDNSITSDYLDGLGVPVLVRAALNHTHVVRTSDTVITVTFPPVAGYEISDHEIWMQVAPETSNTEGEVIANNFIIIINEQPTGNVIGFGTDSFGFDTDEYATF